ncbi:trypsin-like serine peptidase [Crossiella sp. NPDC003009]
MRHLSAVVAVLCTAAALTACVQVSPGQPKAGPSTRNIADEIKGGPTSELRKTFSSTPQQVNDYWNSDRLKDARPKQPGPSEGGSDVPKENPGAQVVIQPSDGVIGQVKPDSNGTNPRGDAWSRAGLSETTVGRLYYTFGGKPYVCSASVVSSPSKSLVATAGHCIWETQGEKMWADNVMFVPGDRAGQAPHGKWAAESIYTTREFMTKAESTDRGTSGEGWAYDIAFLRMRPLNGQKIQDALGAQGMAFGVMAEGLTAIGYPTAPPFDGKVMRYCSSPNWVKGPFGDYTINCVMTPGCSGGPWFTRFDPGRGAGIVVSVSSVGNARTLSGAVLGQVAHNLYKQADSGA